jgi:NAD(P)-dependent dehydrogenase (short-subunit alcohol dehydrogenase family)
MPPTVVVTGASTGIGYATARVLTTAGMRVLGSVRRGEDADRLSRELGPLFVPLLFDVTDGAAVQAGARRVADALDGRTLFGLVNNAGIAIPGPLLHLSIDDFRRQLEVNIVGQLIVTQAFAPLLGADRTRSGSPGRIVMMSSVGGRTATPFVGAYNTSKFALEGFSECLRRELMVFGIDVIVIAPGAIATPIWDKAEAFDPEMLAGTAYGEAARIARTIIDRGRLGLPAARVGDLVRTALTTPRPKHRYTITPSPFEQFVVRSLPKRLIDRITARRLGFR